MKFLHVANSVDPSQGGIAESIIRRTQALLRMGHEVEIVTLDLSSAGNDPVIASRLTALGPGLSLWNFSLPLRRWLGANTSRFDAVIVEGIWQFHAYESRKAAMRCGVPYYVMPHGMLDPWFKRTYPLKHLKKLLFWYWCERRVLRDADAVLFTCREESRLALESFRCSNWNSVVVPFGTSRAPSELEGAEGLFRSSFGLSESQPYLLFLGRIHEKKGLELLVHAWSRLRTELKGYKLVVAGPDGGSYQRMVEGLVESLDLKSEVAWVGMLQGDMKWGCIRGSSLFILPSYQENFGIAVVEALSCGIPVAITNGINIWREIQGDECGFVSAPDVNGVVQSISSWLASSPEARSEMSSAALKCFDRNFSVERMATGLVEAVSVSGVRRE